MSQNQPVTTTQPQSQGRSTAFHLACEQGSVEIVKRLLQQDPSVAKILWTDDNGATPLHSAAKINSSAILELLLEHGADVNAKDDNNVTPLMLAASFGATDSIRLLMEKGADPTTKDIDGRTALFNAVRHSNAMEVLLMNQQASKIVNLQDNDGKTALHFAACGGYHRAVAVLLQYGANILSDSKNRTALHEAAKKGSTKSVKMIVKEKRFYINDVDSDQNQQVSKIVNLQDNDGKTALHYAASEGHDRAVAVLLQYRANILLSDSKNRTALHEAAKKGSTKSVEMIFKERPLFNNDVDSDQNQQASKIVNLKDNSGRTALHYAASEGHDRAVAVLLQYSATIESQEEEENRSRKSVEMIAEKRPRCINYVDHKKNTALHLAAINQHSHLVKLLLANKHQEFPRNSSNQNILDIAIDKNSTELVETIVEDPRCRDVLESWSGGDKMTKLIQNMPHVAERLLDLCVQTEGDRFDKDYKITYDLSLIFCKKNPKEKAESLKILKKMADFQHYRFLDHRLCSILLKEKWNKYGCIVFLLNLFFFLASILPLTGMHVFLEDNDEIYCEDRIINRTSSGEILYDEQIKSCLFNHAPIQILHYFIIVMLSIQILKEIIQCYYQYIRYFTSVSTWIDIIGLGAALFSVLPPCECKWGIQKEAASVAIFLSWINLIMYFRRLPFYGKYVIMLYRMFITLLKVLFLFAFFILAFGATFHLIIDQEPFTSFPNTLMNIFIMTLGEINYVDVFMPWSKLFYPQLVNIILILFCLTMPIVLMNMLVGLAVGDIEKIERDALIDRTIMQVDLLMDIEAALPSCLLRHVHLSQVTDYPNKKPSLFSKVYNSLIGFAPGNKEGEADKIDARTPVMTQLTEKLKEQASKIDHLQKTMETVLQLVREQNRHSFKIQKHRFSVNP